MILGDLGANVLKLNVPGLGDQSSHLGTAFLGQERSLLPGRQTAKKRGLTLTLLNRPDRRFCGSRLREQYFHHQPGPSVALKKYNIDF